MLKRVPKSTLKSLMKKKAHIRVGTAADAMAELNVLLFLHSLAEEARTKAFEEKSATIKAHHVKAVSKRKTAVGLKRIPTTEVLNFGVEHPSKDSSQGNF
eukprot:XP_014060906.1 PREDICTED: centromere protein W-like isoform X1 [Salmo salar]